MADQKLTSLTEISVPAVEDLLYAVDDPSGTPTSNKLTVQRLLGLLNSVCDGRLTTESGVPVSTSDRTAQGTIYFTPYNGNRLSIYDGTRWKLYSFSEISLALSSLTSGKNYDVFVYDNSGTLTLELSAAWTNDTTRADAIALQDGVYVKSGATTRRYLGTIRTTGTTTTEDSATKRFVWNAHNQTLRQLLRQESTVTWTYNSATWRQANGASANQIEVVRGFAGVETTVFLLVSVTNPSGQAGLANIGLGNTTPVAKILFRGEASNTIPLLALLRHTSLGHMSYVWIERVIVGGGASTTFSGMENSGEYNWSGLIGEHPC